MKQCCVIGMLLLSLGPSGGQAQQTVGRERLEEALAAKAAGDSNAQLLLQELLERFPDMRPARWHLGYLGDERQWTNHHELLKTLEHDRSLVAYRQQRAELGEDESLTVAERHRRLAAYCGRRKLPDQQRAHLVSLLREDPADETARRSLQKLTPEASLASQSQNKRQLAEIQSWRRRLTGLGRNLLGVDVSPAEREQVRDQAVKNWQAIDDPLSIPAMEQVFSQRNVRVVKHASQTPHPDWISLAAFEQAIDDLRFVPGPVMVIEKLAEMPHPLASRSLARHAIACDDPVIRRLAIEHLRDRPLDDYVPAALESLAAPGEYRSAVHLTWDGRLVHRRTYLREGAEEKQLLVNDNIHEFAQVPGGNANLALQTALMKIRARDSRSRSEYRMQVLGQLTRNERIHKLLSETTDAQVSSASPSDWRAWWEDYNEVVVEGSKPLRVGYQVQTDISVGVVPSIPSRRRPRERCECLAAGTLVWTDQGPLPIESIQIGDLVLSQHPVSGELALKPVLQTTVREPRPLVRMEIGSGENRETLVSTGGHQFWRNGAGWMRARELEADQTLHALTDNVCILEAAPEAPRQTYNLVVADFHSYFVGKARVLSHDVIRAAPTRAVVPGYIPPRKHLPTRKRDEAEYWSPRLPFVDD